VGGGVALSLTGPRLKTAIGSELELVWTMEVTFSRVGMIGIAILLVTGPLMVWLKFVGFAGFSRWFELKMGFAGLAVIGAALHERAGRRYRAGRGGLSVDGNLRTVGRR
jgi:protoporphyrinogen IX oxidase